MSKYLKEQAAILAEADAKLEVLISQVRRDLLIPFCDRSKLRFTAGMGSWSFDRPNPYNNGQDYFDGDEVPCRPPKALIRFLCADSGLSRNDLGSLMLDYTPIGWRYFSEPKKEL